MVKKMTLFAVSFGFCLLPHRLVHGANPWLLAVHEGRTDNKLLAAADVTDLPLVVIVGPTASGKTELAIRIAKKFNGEVISADSRAIYRGLDIGTAKPTSEEQQGIPHWGALMHKNCCDKWYNRRYILAFI